MPPEIARKNFSLGADARDWKIDWAQKDLVSNALNDQLIRPIYCRPFDKRYTFYSGKTRGFICYPRFAVMKNMFNSNIGLTSVRQVKASGGWSHCLVADQIVESTLISNKTSEIGYFFPLYQRDGTAQTNKKDLFSFQSEKEAIYGVENISSQFRIFIDQKYSHHFTPEDIFGYIYAILHAPTYRAVFSEFLRLDFPRIPFVETRSEFDALSTLGWDLAQKHLLKDVPKLGLGAFMGKGVYEVDKPTYAETDQSVLINKTQYFKPVPREVWEFHIGGYQVIDKYLKSRKGRTLSLDEIENVTNICNVLQFTIQRMAEIDVLYKEAFPDHR